MTEKIKDIELEPCNETHFNYKISSQGKDYVKNLGDLKTYLCAKYQDDYEYGVKGFYEDDQYKFFKIDLKNRKCEKNE